MAGKLNGWTNWIMVTVALSGIVFAGGGIYAKVCDNSDRNDKQDMSIVILQQDMAAIKANTSRTATDVDELKKDVKQLLRRP